VARNGPLSYKMSCHSEVWPTVATFDAAKPILINFRQVRLKCLRMDYDATSWQILHKIASTGPVWPVVGNGGQLCSRISSLNELVHFTTELRDLGLVYQVMECNALWDKIGGIWSGDAYNCHIFVTESIYDRLVLCSSLYYHFWAILALYVMSGYNKIKVPGNAKVARNGP